MSREAEIVAWCEEAAALIRRGYQLLRLDDGEFRRVLTERLQPEARGFIHRVLGHMPLVQRFVWNRMGGKIDQAVANAINETIDELSE